jgi:hypothetical protein
VTSAPRLDRGRQRRGGSPAKNCHIVSPASNWMAALKDTLAELIHSLAPAPDVTDAGRGGAKAAD